MTTAELPLDSAWISALVEVEDRPLLIRIRSEIDAVVGHPGFANLLRVTWDYEANDSGLPEDDDLAAMTRCETDLETALEQGGCGLMTHVLTGDGLRQWVFYVADLEHAAERINAVLPRDTPYPIELAAASDPDWSEYGELHAKLLRSQPPTA